MTRILSSTGLVLMFAALTAVGCGQTLYAIEQGCMPTASSSTDWKGDVTTVYEPMPPECSRKMEEYRRKKDPAYAARMERREAEMRKQRSRARDLTRLAKTYDVSERQMKRLEAERCMLTDEGYQRETTTDFGLQPAVIRIDLKTFLERADEALQEAKTAFPAPTGSRTTALAGIWARCSRSIYREDYKLTSVWAFVPQEPRYTSFKAYSYLTVSGLSWQTYRAEVRSLYVTGDGSELILMHPRLYECAKRLETARWSSPDGFRIVKTTHARFKASDYAMTVPSANGAAASYDTLTKPRHHAIFERYKGTDQAGKPLNCRNIEQKTASLR